MFSLFSFIRLFLAILLATGSTWLPIIGDVGDIIDGGIAGSIVGFVISVIFYWFIISKISEFLVFTFGGGVGRYHATRQYRRLQWLTFSLFMTIPVFVIAILIFTATPFAENSEYYNRSVEREEERRYDAAVEAQKLAYDEAVEARRERIRSARTTRTFRIGQARDAYQKRVDEAIIAERTRLQAAHRIVIDNKNDISDAKLATFKETLNNLTNYISTKTNEELDRDFNEFMELTFRRFSRAYHLYSHEDQVFPSRIWRNTPGNYEQLILLYDERDCEGLVKNKENRLNLSSRTLCLYLFILVNINANADKLYGSINETPKPVRSLGRFLRAAYQQHKDSLRALDEIKELKSKHILEIENASHDLPPLDLSGFPEISESDFPAINLADFPISPDKSPMGIEDDYFSQISPTFEKHFWWLAIAAFAAWVALLRLNQGRIASFYAPIRGFLDGGRMSFGGSARFATMFEEWGKPYRPGTFYVGKSLYNPYDEIGLDGEAHMLTIAGSRGGKGSSVIIPNLLLWEGSAVVIDPKGTNAHVTAQARRDMGHDVHLIDPFGVVTKESSRFDPFDGLNPDSELVGEEIRSIADALVAPDDEKTPKDPHWDESARTILAGLMSHVLSSDQPQKWLYHIRDLVRQLPEQQDRMWAEMALNERAGQHAKSAAIRFIRGQDSNEILSIMSNADKHTEWLSSPIMRRITSNPTFRIRDIKKRPTTIYLIIPPRQIQRQKRLIRLFINLVIDSVEKGGKSDVPILMMIDEFLSLGRMQEFPDSFATMASYNLMLWPFVQDLGRLKEIYGNGVNTFVSNSRAVQVFAVTDEETKKFVSEKLGNRPLLGLGGIARSNENVALRSTDDIDKDISAASGRQYIITAGQSAVLAERVPYYAKGTRFSGKYAPDPDYG